MVSCFKAGSHRSVVIPQWSDVAVPGSRAGQNSTGFATFVLESDFALRRRYFLLIFVLINAHTLPCHLFVWKFCKTETNVTKNSRLLSIFIVILRHIQLNLIIHKEYFSRFVRIFILTVGGLKGVSSKGHSVSETSRMDRCMELVVLTRILLT